MPLVQDEGIVVGDFFARRDGFSALDENPAVFLHRLAVRPARVVDPSRHIARESRVDGNFLVDRKKKGMRRFVIEAQMARIGDLRGQAFAAVFDQAFVLAYRRGGENATAVDAGGAADESAGRIVFGSGH